MSVETFLLNKNINFNPTLNPRLLFFPHTRRVLFSLKKVNVFLNIFGVPRHFTDAEIYFTSPPSPIKTQLDF